MEILGKQNLDWSGKHTRLRYQMVISCIGILLVSTHEIKSFKFPGFFEFNGIPNYSFIWLSFFSFAVFSTIAFWLQTKFEQAALNIPTARIVTELEHMLGQPLDVIYESVPELDGSAFAKVFLENLKFRKLPAEKFDKEKFYTNSAVISVHVSEITNFNYSASNRLSFWRSDFDALLPDLVVLANENLVELRRMNNIMNKSEEANKIASESWATLSTYIPESVDLLANNMNEFQMSKFQHALEELDKHLELIKKSVIIFRKYGHDVLAAAKRNNDIHNLSTKLLASKIPLILSIAILGVSICFSIYNCLVFWEILK